MIDKIPLQDEVLESLFQRIMRNFPQNVPAIDNFIKLTVRAGKKEKAKDLIISLINSQNYRIGLDSFNKHKEIFVQHNCDEIGKAIISKYQTLPFENWEAFLNVLTEPEINYSNTHIDDLGENLLEHIKNDNINIRNFGRKYYLSIKDQISDRKAKFIGQQLVAKLSSSQSSLSENASPIFDILIEEQERLERYTIEDLIDILLGLLHESKPLAVRNMAIRYFESLRRLYRRSSQVLDQLLVLSRRANPGERENIVKALISFNKFKGRKSFWKEARVHLKELNNSENKNDKSIGEWALGELK